VAELMGLHHLALTVSDARRSAEWYQRVLGLTVIAEFDEDAGARHKVILTDAGSSVLIGLVEHRHGAADRFDERRTGLDHLALTVGGRVRLAALAARLDRMGVPRSQIVPATLDPRNAVLVFRDPDNIQLEFFAVPVDEPAGATASSHREK
jgi:glyoxylase I family protein